MSIIYSDVVRTLLIGGALLTLNFNPTYAKAAVVAKLVPQVEENDLSSAAEKTKSEAAVDAKAEKKDEPEKMVSTDAEPDSAAISKLKIADNHRNHRTNFGYKDSQKEALRLYEEIMNDKKVSVDVRARAKINYANVYKEAYWLNDTVKSEQRNADALRLFNEVAHETDISPDLKGWAKRHLADLYLSNGFDMDPAEAQKKSISLLLEVCADPAVGSETKGRAKLSLASRYTSKEGQKDLGLTEEECKVKAIALLNEIIDDTKARPDLRAEAKLSLAEHSSEEDDFYKEKMLKLYKDVIADKSITPVLRAQTKASLAFKYVSGDGFNVKKSEANKIGLTLMEEAANDTALPIKERLNYKYQLGWWYENYSDLLPSEANAKALKLAIEVIEESRVDQKEYFQRRIQLARSYSFNQYRQKRAEAISATKKLYSELLNDKTLPIEDRIEVREDLARKYQQSRLGFEPEAGKDVKTTVMDLYNEILNDPELKQEDWFKTKCSIANMYGEYQARKIGMKKGEAKAEKLRLYNELADDKKLTPEQKKKVKKIIERLEKPDA